MKLTIYLIISILFFGISSIGQTVEFYKVENYHVSYSDMDLVGSSQADKFRKKHIFYSTPNNLGELTLKSGKNTIQKLDSLIIQKWNEETAQWVIDSKRELIYDAKGLLTQIHEYNRDEITNTWKTFRKSEYSYDSKGKMVQELYQDWDENIDQWKNDYKGEFFYNESEMLISEIFSDFYTQWKTSYKFDYTYDNDQMIQELDYNWDENTSQWIIYNKEEYIYDINETFVQNIGYNWNANTNLWTSSYMFEWTYDANGNVSQWLFKIWNEESEQWINNSKQNHSYDLTLNLSDLVCPPLGWFMPNSINNVLNKPVEYSKYKWDTSMSNWVVNNKGKYYYSEQIVSTVDIIEEEIFSIYPNPVTENLYFNCSERNNTFVFKLINSQGKQVISEVINDNEGLDLSSLSNGLYIYSMTVNGVKKIGKLIKK